MSSIKNHHHPDLSFPKQQKVVVTVIVYLRSDSDFRVLLSPPCMPQKTCRLKLSKVVGKTSSAVQVSHESNLDRKARRRGGKASKRGLSDEQVPKLVAVDHSGTKACSVLPFVTADSVQCVLKPKIDDDILLVTDGNNVYPPCAKSVGIKYEVLNRSAGERVGGAIHKQSTNNRHGGA